MRFTISRSAHFLAATVLLGLSAPASAMQDCSSTKLEAGPNFMTGPDCTISWIEHGRLNTLIWRPVQDDFQEASLEIVGDRPVLTASGLPELIDVDQDGWLDLVTFTPVGMVNGTFGVSLRGANGGSFTAAQQIYGHTLSRDRDGYIVAASRNGPGQLYQLYMIDAGAFVFQVEIDPFAAAAPGSVDAFTCYINSARNGGVPQPLPSGKVPEDKAVLEHYCDPSANEPRRDVDITVHAASPSYTPTDTVFYCRLEGGTHAVSISQTPKGMRYAYGYLNAKPELILEQTHEDTGLVTEGGGNAARVSAITFGSGPFLYMAGTRLDPSSGIAQPGLTVVRAGIAVPIFDKDCLPEHSYDGLAAFYQDFNGG
ncbi:hypothetical protein Q9295_11905 [Xinfangfangia sp. CPCC 101601]|uniref:VCBS repeat-containing protein n=1 Tax=Pseudogemmobacter lacusdianii TaxID=3069608 RepID=A0ABU0VZA9_9RHOB|nr:hypothetical protein [Xinfangfangia sp. CPCC 101601]MDQ2067083.1 hypothetical protein [Xinfangfangia sp. CPCC 101601]